MDLKILIFAGLLVGVFGADPTGPCKELKEGANATLVANLLKISEFLLETQWSDGKQERLLKEYHRETPAVKAVQRTDNSKTMYHWIFNTKSTTYAKNAVCKIGQLGKEDETPLGMKLNLTNYGIPGGVNSIKDLVTQLQSLKTFVKAGIVTNAKNLSFHDHDMGDVDHWMGCLKDPSSKKTLQITVCYPKPNSTYNFVDTNGRNFPIKMELLVFASSITGDTIKKSFKTCGITEYDDKNAPTDTEYNFEISTGNSAPSMNEAQDISMISPSIFCEGNPKVALPLPTNTSFKVGIHYREQAQSGCHDSVKVMLDADHRIIAYTFTRNKTNDDYLAQSGANKGLTEGSRYTVVHDYRYGLEYVIGEPDQVCTVPVRPIPTDSGDALPSVNGTLSLLNAPELLFRNPKTPATFNFSKAGNFSQNGGNLYSVYNAKWAKDEATASEKFLVVEASFEGKSRPVNLITHHHDKISTFSTSQSFEDFEVFAAGTFPYEEISISPCLSFTNDSFLYMTLNVPVAEVEKKGLAKVKNVMRQWIAEKAGVSILRIGQFYFKATETKMTLVFFSIAEKSGVNSTVVVDQVKEINVTEAVRALNATLNATVPIPDLAISIANSSLQRIPKAFHPSAAGPIPAPVEIKQGYSSGSMAALAICMILIGGAMGMVVAFFMWKRNRGIAYQVYE